MPEEQLILKKIGEIKNGDARFILAEIESKSGEFGLLAQQGLVKVVLRAERQQLIDWFEGLLHNLRTH